MDNIVRGVLYYPCSMVLGQFFCRFTGSEAQTHCARRPQLVSKKFLEEEIFAGTNFRELAFDRENREIFCLAKISLYTVYLGLFLTLVGLCVIKVKYSLSYEYFLVRVISFVLSHSQVPALPWFSILVVHQMT